MQNRRLFFDDDRGVEEPLNEVDPVTNQGIAVNAQYRVQIFDSDKSESVQRRAQLVIDEPIQVFYTSSFELTSATTQKKSDSVQKVLQSFAEQGQLKVHLFPLEADQILIRVANIADLIDGSPESTPLFDLEGYAQALFESVNGVQSEHVELTERTLGNNMDIDSVAKAKWNTQELVTDYQKPVDGDQGQIALEPQRIRLFKAVFSSAIEQSQQGAEMIADKIQALIDQ